MAYGYEEKALEMPHKLTLDGRARLTLTRRYRGGEL